MSERWDQSLNELMLSAEDSHARTSVLPDECEAWQDNAADYGPNTCESFASYDPPTSSWKTYQLCFDWASDECSEIWPRSGMTRSGTAYRLRPSVRLTSVIGFSSWPTPNAMDGTSMRLRDSPANWALQRQKHQAKGQRKQLSLVIAVKAFPFGPIPLSQEAMIREILLKYRQMPALSGLLNPRWVEWLMGYPDHWTACMDSATPSSRK